MTLVCPPTTTGKVGTAFASSFVATGGVHPYTFSTPTGSLPTGLTLNATTGAITGTPAVPSVGTLPEKWWIPRLQEQHPPRAIAAASPISALPIASNCATISAIQEVAITSVTLSASGVGAPYTYSATGLPAGLSIFARWCHFSTPTVNGTFPYGYNQGRQRQPLIFDCHCRRWYRADYLYLRHNQRNAGNRNQPCPADSYGRCGRTVYLLLH